MLVNQIRSVFSVMDTKQTDDSLNDIIVKANRNCKIGISIAILVMVLVLLLSLLGGFFITLLIFLNYNGEIDKKIVKNLHFI